MISRPLDDHVVGAQDNAGDPMFVAQIDEYKEQLTKAEHGELEPGPMPGVP